MNHLQKKQNLNSTYIKIKIEKENKETEAYIDTGASICIATKSLFSKWEKLEKPLKIQIADGSIHPLNWVATRITLRIQDKLFMVPTVYQQETGLDMIIGNNFLRLYAPFCQYLEYISIKAPYIRGKQMKEIIDIPIIHSSETFYSKKQSELLKLKRGEIIGIVCRKIRHVLVNLEPGRKIPVHIEELLDKVCSENPLDPKINNKNMELVELKLKDPTREIKCKPMIYTKQDRDEFAEDIKQMCEK